VKGVISIDKVNVAGVELDDIKFGETTEEFGTGFMVFKFDGILGLGFDTIAVDQVPPIFYNMIDKLDKPLFSVFLGRKGSNLGGEVLFGDIDSTYVDPEKIEYVSVSRVGYWEVPFNSLTVGEDQVLGGTHRAAIDTGTTLIVGPAEYVDKLSKLIGAIEQQYGLYFLECNKMSSLPDIKFRFNDVELSLSPHDYVNVYDNVCMSAFTTDHSASSQNPLWIVGDTLLKKYYTVYDMGLKRVGFGSLKV
jgi:saccharopepsin